jgi:hypothetical protein
MGIAVAKKKTGPKPKVEGVREVLIGVKCRRSYKEWVERFARKRRTTPSQLIDVALMDLARADGFEPPPER